MIGTALAALSAVAFDWGVRRQFGDDLGWPAVGIFVPLIASILTYPIATNGYLGAPILVFSTLAFLEVAASGSTLAACLCGASLAFAAELHPATLLSLPVFVTMVLLSCERPIRALFLGVMTGVTLAMALSADSWVYNAQSIFGQRWSIASVVSGVAAAFLFSSLGRPRWRALDAAQRRWLLLVAIVGSVPLEMLVASVAARRVLANGTCLMFLVPALAILVALGLRRAQAFGRLGRAAAIGLPIALLAGRWLMTIGWWLGVATGTVSAPAYSMREAESLAHDLWARGYTLPDVQRHLRAAHGFELFSAIASFAPSPDGPLERPMPDIRIVTFSERNRPDGPIPAGGEEVNLGFGRRAWILPLEGWVRVAPSRVCFEPWTAAGGGDCVDIASDSIAYTGRYRDLHERPLPALRDARGRVGDSAMHRVRFKWELPVEITGDDTERHFDLVGLMATPWVIERVDGVAYRGNLPARHVALQRGGALSGRLVLAPSPSEMSLKDYPPDFLETRPGEDALRESLRVLPPFGGIICSVVGTCPDPVGG